MDSSNIWKGIAMGGIASCTADIVTLPIDTVKV